MPARGVAMQQPHVGHCIGKVTDDCTTERLGADGLNNRANTKQNHADGPLIYNTPSNKSQETQRKDQTPRTKAE